MQGVVAIPDPQLPRASFARCRVQPQAWQHAGQNCIGIRLLLADECAHADAVPAAAREGPTEAVVHQAELKVGHIRRDRRSLHFDRDGGGIAGAGWPQAQVGGEAGAGAIGDHQAPGFQLLALAIGHLPAVALAVEGRGGAPVAQIHTPIGGLAGQKVVEHPAAHDPKGGITGQLGHHRILQAPGEPHLTNHLVNGGLQVKRKPLLHRGGHATAAGLAPAGALLFELNHPPSLGGQMEGRSRSGRSSPKHNHVGVERHAQTLRMSVSLSAKCFSSSLMKRSVNFWILSCSSRL